MANIHESAAVAEGMPGGEVVDPGWPPPVQKLQILINCKSNCTKIMLT